MRDSTTTSPLLSQVGAQYILKQAMYTIPYCNHILQYNTILQYHAAILKIPYCQYLDGNVVAVETVEFHERIERACHDGTRPCQPDLAGYVRVVAQGEVELLQGDAVGGAVLEELLARRLQQPKPPEVTLLERNGKRKEWKEKGMERERKAMKE